ncbi:pre-mRNA-splicing factor ATP-dependent RNA helicase DEAH10 isoform X1 [Physcomitrium patens]|uniref:RNA helicase n=2 Tax=Physcomitrium patens TaxID=3218 RepID=A0A2K1K3P1_PHYPA|nr:pre-mRNA-splicing factor ATP-dependent RNA helicase DEAH10-like isoform X1 [Physcomitrium patens]PNR48389.1 hypothetical protein PHYPA_012865 [Physcomitrium patens]|eukprot:XP_024384968.1 pre-mRNA-splicing factor ATP-dependent RNA helicase DEAH10-like isoform X1 [Physcomitrella patens]
MPSMAPLSSGNKNGDGNGNVPGRGNGVPFGGHWGPPESTSATPSAANEAVGKRKATTLLPQTRVTKRQALLNQRRALPIASVESELVNHVKKNETLVVIGETGSGKTTQLPQFLHSAGFCKGGMMVAITQPRRVAAITVATRVAEEMGVEVGQEVGYSIRFEDCTSPSTQLKYMTDGMLLREALLDPLLSRYSLVVIDEAHERTIHTDVLFGLLKGVQKRRQAASTATKSSKKKAATTGVALKDLQNLLTTSKTPLEKKNSALKLVVMSATLDTKGFCEYFNGAEAVYVQGRQFPVEIFYTFTPEADYLDAALLTTFQIHLEEIPGDILLFLTGQEEIESMERLLKERASHLSPKVPKLLVVPIYAALPSEQQMRVFQPAPDGTRKVILATNIAETSLTIPGIRYVIDPGLVKARAYNPRTGVESLEVVPVSKAQARQRSGRAGRERPGKCFRLYTEDLYRKLEDSTVPEIKRCNLANVVLQLKAFGIDDVLGFDFMDKPSRIAIVKSLEHLYSLGALTDEGKLSDPIGTRMARFPLEPMYAKAMLISCEMGCSEEMLATVSMMSVDSVFYAPRDKLQEANNARNRFISADGDHITLINVLRHYIQEAEEAGAGAGAGEAEDTSSNSNSNENKKVFKRIRSWCTANFINARSLKRAVDIQKQIRGYVEGMGLTIISCGDDMLSFRRCLAASFFLNAARRQLDGTYRALASGQSVAIHPSSVLFGQKPDCVVFNELVRTNRSYIRNITRVDSLWLPELAPHYYAAQALNTPCQS